MIEHMKISDLEDPRNKNNFGKFSKIRIIGIIKNLNKIVTKSSGEPMAKFEMEDFTGVIEAICFPKNFIDIGYKLIEDTVIMAEGHINYDGNKKSFIINTVNELDALEENKFLDLCILIDNESKEKVSELKNLIIKNKGNNQVSFAMNIENNKKEVVKMSSKYNVNLSENFMTELIKLVGRKKIRIR